LKTILSKVQKELKEKEEIREEVQKIMRKATRVSKQAILLTHQENYEKAEKLLNEATNLFVRLNEISKTHPDLVYTGMVDAAFQEYAEANTFLTLVKEDKFTDPTELKIPTISYMLGLADVIGEFRRRALDLLRKGNIKMAEKCLNIMEQIYVELMAMDDAYLLVPGLRRKCDVARHIIETTRGDITMETRRTTLEESIRRLEKTLKKK
jgi:translin